jgi:hypothetical protein
LTSSVVSKKILAQRGASPDYSCKSSCSIASTFFVSSVTIAFTKTSHFFTLAISTKPTNVSADILHKGSELYTGLATHGKAAKNERGKNQNENNNQI